MHRWFIKFVLVAMLSFMANTALAANESCAKPSDSVASLDPQRNDFLGTLLSRVIDGEGSAGGSTAQKLISSAGEIASTNAMPLAKSLGGVLAVISILFAAIFAALNKESIGGAVIEVLIKAAVVGGILSAYGAIVVGGFTELQSALTSISGSTNVGNILGQFINNIMRALYQPFAQAYAAIGCSSLWGVTLAMIGDAILASFVLLAGAFLLIIAVLQALVGLLMGPFVLAIALAVGPISIACAVNGVTSSAFDKWLGFAISGAVMTGIGGIVLRLFSETMIVTDFDSSFGTTAASLAFLINALIAGKLFSHIPDFANALSPHGGSGARSGGKLPFAVAGGAVGMAMATPAAPIAAAIGGYRGYQAGSGNGAFGKAYGASRGATGAALNTLKQGAKLGAGSANSKADKPKVNTNIDL